MDQIKPISFSIASDEEILKSKPKKKEIEFKKSEEYEKYMEEKYKAENFKNTIQKVIKMIDFDSNTQNLIDLNKSKIYFESLKAYTNEKYFKEKLD